MLNSNENEYPKYAQQMTRFLIIIQHLQNMLGEDMICREKHEECFQDKVKLYRKL